MKKTLLLLIFGMTFCFSNAQTGKYWSSIPPDSSPNKQFTSRNKINDYKLYSLDINSLRRELFLVVKNNSKNPSTIISVPNSNGKIEDFEVFEASNFESELQAQFPDLRSFSGKGITDPTAILKLSISPYGIQTMVIRADRPNEFIDSYSNTNSIYAVYKKNDKDIEFRCTTEEMLNGASPNAKFNLNNTSTKKSNVGQLKTMRLALSCTGEYSRYHAGLASQAPSVTISLAAINNTLARCNGVFEKDLGLHLNLIAATTNVIYLDPATDPYGVTNLTNPSNEYNIELQNALTSRIGNAVYDIGHLLGGIGKNGNAGCVGCVCADDDPTRNNDLNKGSGYTTNTNPIGDAFDLDFVTHEIGHQLGANHTFTYDYEETGVNVEPGSGYTIMGYAGITPFDVAPHSIDKFHAASIQQIQQNLASKPCLNTINIATNNATPTANAGLDYVIPISTPFVLEGKGTDSNGTNVLTYSWEEIDVDNGTNIGADSAARIDKKVGPLFTSYNDSSSPNRYFPRINSIISNSPTTLATGNTSMVVEALSAVERELNFRLTVRDNAPYRSTVPISVGQTNFDDMKVSVSSKAGPFVVTTPNMGLSWMAGSNQMITWNVAGTNSNLVDTAFVDILLSTDGGMTYNTIVATKVPNDGSETVCVPNNVGNNNRIMVRGHQNIFFDISNANFSITASPDSFRLTSGVSPQSAYVCTENSVSFQFLHLIMGGFNGNTTFTATGLPAGATATFSPDTVSGTDRITMTIDNLSAVANGNYNITVTGTSGTITKTIIFNLQKGMSIVPTIISPVNNALGLTNSVPLQWNAVSNATSYDVQVSTSSSFATFFTNINVPATKFVVNGLANGTTYYWRVLAKNAGCSTVYSTVNSFATGNPQCAAVVNSFQIINIPANLAINTNGNIVPFTASTIINISSGKIISDINVRNLNITHQNIADLEVVLTSPSGKKVKLFKGGCDLGNTLSQNINSSFDDEANIMVCNACGGGTCAAITGINKPVVLPNPVNLAVSYTKLSDFIGENPVGDWTLTITDHNQGSGGSLNSWGLELCSLEQVLQDKNFEFEGFNLYPNPNNGTFTVHFRTENSNDINVNVYDLRGRNIYEKKYNSSNAIFNQTLELNHLQSGVYFVAITDGVKKTVKRIIFE